MGSWNNTAFVRAEDIDSVFVALEYIFARDGYCRSIGQLSLSESDRYSMQYGNDRDSRVWGVAAFRCNLGWALLKTAPFELLVRSHSLCTAPRLSLLAMLTERYAFQVSVGDSSFLSLLECTPSGASYRQGETYGTAALVDDFYASQDSEIPVVPSQEHRFLLNDSPLQFILSAEMVRHGVLEGDPIDEIETIGRRLSDLPLEQWDNRIQAEYLIPQIDIPQAGWKVAYFERTA